MSDLARNEECAVSVNDGKSKDGWLVGVAMRSETGPYARGHD